MISKATEKIVYFNNYYNSFQSIEDSLYKSLKNIYLYSSRTFIYS